MSQQAATEGDFRRVTGKRLGYRVSEVNEFFTALADDYERLLTAGVAPGEVQTSRTIRDTVFASEEGGYLPIAVDRALDRVEDRFAEIERRLYIERYGDAAWQESLEDLKALLLGRLERPEGERFRRPAKRLTKGYLTKDVDQLCDRMLGAIRGQQTLVPEDIRGVAFRSTAGSLSYDETQVDAFLSRCIEYLQDTL